MNLLKLNARAHTLAFLRMGLKKKKQKPRIPITYYACTHILYFNNPSSSFQIQRTNIIRLFSIFFFRSAYVTVYNTCIICAV